MSRKFYLITIAITLAISTLIILLFVYSRNKVAQTNIAPIDNKSGYELLPIEELTQKPSLQIQTEKGKITINNIYKNPIEQLSKNGVTFAKNTDYYMAFYPQDDGFLISINNSEVISAERKAEDAFLKQLGVTKDQACQLKVSITVPASVSEKYSGGVYGFSFCSGVDHIE
jgi:hypothetical protein